MTLRRKIGVVQMRGGKIWVLDGLNARLYKGSIKHCFHTFPIFARDIAVKFEKQVMTGTVSARMGEGVRVLLKRILESEIEFCKIQESVFSFSRVVQVIWCLRRKINKFPRKNVSF